MPHRNHTTLALDDVRHRRHGASTSARAARFLALLLTLLAGCTSSWTTTPGCDHVELLALTEVLERDVKTSSAEVEAIRALGAACPGLYPGYLRELRRTYGPLDPKDPSFIYDRWLRPQNVSVCADPAAWESALEIAAPEDWARVAYKACDLARLGVLDPGEDLVDDDLLALFALAVLERDGVGRPLLRRLGRALITSVAPLPVARRRCLEQEGGDACVRAVRLRGVDLPVTNASHDHVRHEPRLILGRDAIYWDGELLAPLERGVKSPRSALGDRLAWLAADASDLEIAADRELPFDYVIESLYRTRGTETNASLVVLGRDFMVKIPLLRPRRWFDDEERSPAAEVVIDRESVRIAMEDGEVTTVPAEMTETLTATAEERRGAMGDGVGTYDVSVTPGTRVDVVVRVLGALRGPKCKAELYSDGEGCLLRWPIIDLEPSRVGRDLPRLPGW